MPARPLQARRRAVPAGDFGGCRRGLGARHRRRPPARLACARRSMPRFLSTTRCFKSPPAGRGVSRLMFSCTSSAPHPGALVHGPRHLGQARGCEHCGGEDAAVGSAARLVCSRPGKKRPCDTPATVIEPPHLCAASELRPPSRHAEPHISPAGHSPQPADGALLLGARRDQGGRRLLRGPLCEVDGGWVRPCAGLPNCGDVHLSPV